MNFIEIIDTFTFYGIDVILLAAATAMLTQVLKITLFRKAQKKIITFLPFVLGTLLYAVYAGVRNLSFIYVVNEYTQIVEHGISVGAAATLYYVLYEQFIRKTQTTGETEKVISTLIEGYVPAENVEQVAKTIAAALERDVTGNGANRTAEILAEYSEARISENDILLLSRLIIETLAHINTSK